MPREIDALRLADGGGDAGAPAAEAVDLGPLEDWVGFRLRMAQIASFQSFARHTQSVGLSPGRFAALLLIDRNPGISQTMLARAIGSDKSTLTPMLDALVKRGLIGRARTQSDRRLYQLSLTDEGRAVLKAMYDCARNHERELDTIVGPRDRAAFVRIMKRITAALGS